jgi:2-polyprenyl-3-methyl-5-hydroxy-6-metoxy-1,4-benzoquinol methylase
LRRFSVPPGRALDAGCGNGKTAVWLAERGFQVVGIDLSPAAISQARTRAERHGVADRTAFYEGRFPNELPNSSGNLAAGFTFITERAFLQHLGRGPALSDTVDILADLLTPAGVFYSLMIASEGASGYLGITKWSQGRIRHALEPRFEIIFMERDVFTPGEPGSVPAWITVMRPVGRSHVQ